MVPNQAGLHARPAALLAATAAEFNATIKVAAPGKIPVSATSPIGLATLDARQGTTLEIEASGPQAQEAVVKLTDLVRNGFGELDTEEPESAIPTSHSLGVSPGRVVGPAFRAQPPLTAAAAAAAPVGTVTQETKNLKAAFETVSAAYEAQATASPPHAREILLATSVLARDDAMQREALNLIENQQMSAAQAAWRATTHVATNMARAGGRLAERVTDISDIRDRVVSWLLGVPLPGLPDPDEPFVLVAADLAPSQTATLDAEHCIGIVTALGGPTSHTSILARGLGIPAIVGMPAALEVADGTQVLVDGDSGEFIVNPTPEQAASARTSPIQLEPLPGPGATSDGVNIKLLANVGSATQAATAAQAGAEGVGLFRTEICFLDHSTEPSITEQVEIYRSVFGKFPGDRVVIRTLDAGSDKPLPFLTSPGEENPALGVRGYRTSTTYPAVLTRQLEAIVETGVPDVWVMAPMISTAAEAAAFVETGREVGLQHLGVMIETPAAALQAAEICEIVDFVSVGTNDLTQYAMAADRQSLQLESLLDPWQPAILRLLAGIGSAASTAEKPAGICGEAAADPELAVVLSGLGFTSLSMSSMSLKPVFDRLATTSMAACTQAADLAVRAIDPQAARAAVQQVLASSV